VGVTIGTGLSQGGDVRRGAREAAAQAGAALGGEPADLVVVFAAGAYLAEPEEVLATVHEALAPAALVGCGAGGVLRGAREVEAGTAVTVWAAALDGGVATPFHAYAEPTGEDTAALLGLPDLTGASGALLLPDPYSFPTDAVLREVTARTPGVPVLGGLASGRSAGGGAVLFLDEDVLDAGAVGVRLDDVELLPCVSQGATPLGPELTITAAEGHVITELAGRPALEKLREVVLSLESGERDSLISRGLLLGLVIDGGKPEYGQGDFLVRGLVAADPSDGTIAVGADVAPGQVVRLHARDAVSADRDLREALGLRRLALGGDPAGALVFTCNGRGRGMFGEPDHDAGAIGAELGGVPAAGFFAAGEIGPVGGETFLHAFTATLAVFAR
jgi:small ligand-binding sensory domain FIST